MMTRGFGPVQFKQVHSGTEDFCGTSELATVFGTQIERHAQQQRRQRR